MASSDTDNPTIRTIVESDLYSKQLKKLGDIKRLDEVLRGFQFTVGWAPECGQETANPKIRAIVVGGYGVDGLVIYYSFNEHKVMLESIELADKPES